jgi:hypothetical protein
MAKFKSVPPQRMGLAIDWETSGYSLPNYAESHSGISFGAAIFDTTTFEMVDSVYCEVKPDPTKIWSAEAEAIHGLSQDYLAAFGVTQDEAAIKLCTMVLKWIATGKVLALGHRVAFDIAFTNALTSVIDVQFDWDPIKLDSAAIGAIFLGETSSDGVFRKCGFTDRAEHNALEDIILTLESVRTIKQQFLRGA